MCRAILEWDHYHFNLSQSTPQLDDSPHQELNLPGHEGGLATLLSPDDQFFAPRESQHAVQDAAYTCMCEFIIFYVLLFMETLDVGWVFVQHFCNRLGPSYLALKNVLDETNPTHAAYTVSVTPFVSILRLLEWGPSVDENYGLASAQSLKNKDIPEGGAKGTILPS